MKNGIRAVVGVVLLGALVVAIALFMRDGRASGPRRTLVVDGITLTYDGAQSLAVIVEYRPADGSPLKPWAYAMLGNSAGQVTLPQRFPVGAAVVFRFGVGADILAADGRVVESGAVRGLTCAHMTEPLTFRTARSESTYAVPAGVPATLQLQTTGPTITVSHQR